MIRRSRCLLIACFVLLVSVPLIAEPRLTEHRKAAKEISALDLSRLLFDLFPLGLEPVNCVLFGDCSPGIDPNGIEGASASRSREAGPKSRPIFFSPGEKLQGSK